MLDHLAPATLIAAAPGELARAWRTLLDARTRGRCDEVVAASDGLLGIARARDDVAATLIAHLARAEAEVLAGVPGDGVIALDQAQAIADGVGSSVERAVCLGSHAEIVRWARPDEAARLARSAHRLLVGTEGEVPAALAAFAELLAAELFLAPRGGYLAEGGLGGEDGAPIVARLGAGLRAARRAGLGVRAARTRGLLAWRLGDLTGARRSLVRAHDDARAAPLDRVTTALIAGTTIAEAAFEDRFLAWIRDARVIADGQGWAPLALAAAEAAHRLGGDRLPEVAPTAVRTHAPAELEALANASRLLLDAEDPELVLGRILAASVSLLGAERGFVFTRTRPGEPLTLRLAQTAGGGPIADAEGQVSRGVIEEVERNGAGLAVADTEREELLRERRSVAALNLRSVICAALTLDGATTGIIYLDSQVTRAVFAAPELALLRSFAAIAAAALDHALQASALARLGRELDAKIADRTRELEVTNQSLTASLHEIRERTQELEAATRLLVEREVEVARRIQVEMVPPPGPIQTPEGVIDGRLEPADACGGDMWAMARGPAGLRLFVGDVTGHGLASALVAGAVRSCFETLARAGGATSPDAILAQIDRVIQATSGGLLLMTGFVAELDATRRTLRYASAAHNPQWLLRTASPAAPTALFERTKRLGERGGEPFKTQETTYAAGDRLVLYTDGLVECLDPAGEEFGDRRMRRLLRAPGPPGTLRGALERAVVEHRRGAPLADDVTLVVVDLA